MNKPSATVMIMAGGTGGHVYPGLAVAQALQKLQIGSHWLGSIDSFESKLVPQHDIAFSAVKISALRGKGLLRIALMPALLARAVWQARRIFKSVRPQAAVSFGGFAAGPGGIAAWLTRTPLIVHEQNRIPGLTNRVLAKIARAAWSGFPGVHPKQANSWVGNPVRADIAGVAAPEVRMQGRTGALRVLVLGGSSGAHALNQAVPKMLAELSIGQRPQLRHQCGARWLEATQSTYTQLGLDASAVQPFLSDMAQQYAWADVVLCRAGALTIAELCAAGVGAVLVPFPHAVDDHQTANARWLLEHDAGTMMPQTEISPASLRAALNLDQSPEQARAYWLARARNARMQAKPDAAAECAQRIQAIIAERAA